MGSDAACVTARTRPSEFRHLFLLGFALCYCLLLLSELSFLQVRDTVETETEPSLCVLAVEFVILTPAQQSQFGTAIVWFPQ